MFENSAIKVATTKLVSASAPYVPGSLILLSGVVVWHLWRKQGVLQTRTNKLSAELGNVKKQVADIKVANNKKENNSESPLSSSFKKISEIKLPWAK
jgi:hypothetical protein